MGGILKMLMKEGISGSIYHKNTSYPVVVQTDEGGGYWVSCPVFPGCYSQGETIDEALKNIREAILLCKEEASPRRRRFSSEEVSIHFVRV